MTISRISRLLALGLAICSVLAVVGIEIDWARGFEGGLSIELKLWVVAQFIALVLAVRTGSFRYLIATWALYLGMSAIMWTTLSTDIKSGVAQQSTIWYALSALSMVGLLISLTIDATKKSIGSN